MEKTKVGLIGCGMISGIYLKNCIERFGNMEFVTCADIIPEAAQKTAEQFGLKACTVEELLNNSELEVVLNLTIPDQHAPINMRILQAGKHAYSEKPFATSLSEGEEILSYAKKRGLYVGCAPDTFMGGALQTCRKLLDEGAIGKPFAAQAFMLSCGPEWFHPNPAFFYQAGAGPLMDWGPYYLTAMVSLLGSVKRVAGVAKNIDTQRKAIAETSKYYGQNFPVEVPTYVTSMLDFDNGVVANLTTSFDMKFPYWEAGLPFIQIFGTEGILDIPDVNKYEGPIMLRKGVGNFEEIQLQYGFTDNSRGMGLCDMVHSIKTGKPYRANGDIGLHVSEIMLGILQSAEKGEFYEIKHKCERPLPLPENIPEYLYK